MTCPHLQPVTGAVKQLDIEAQAQSIFDQTKRKATKITAEMDRLDNEKKTYFRDRDDLDAEKERLAQMGPSLLGWNLFNE